MPQEWLLRRLKKEVVGVEEVEMVMARLPLSFVVPALSSFARLASLRPQAELLVCAAAADQASRCRRRRQPSTPRKLQRTRALPL